MESRKTKATSQSQPVKDLNNVSNFETDIIHHRDISAPASLEKEVDIPTRGNGLVTQIEEKPKVTEPPNKAEHVEKASFTHDESVEVDKEAEISTNNAIGQVAVRPLDAGVIETYGSEDEKDSSVTMEHVEGEKQQEKKEEKQAPEAKRTVEPAGVQAKAEVVKAEEEEEEKKAGFMEKHEYSQHLLQFLCPYIKSGNDINLGYMSLHWLNDDAEFKTTFPEQCGKCKAYMSSLSRLSAPEKWRCEFCRAENAVTCPAVPTDAVTLINMSGEKLVQSSQEIKIVMCIDISSSMNVSVVVNEKVKGDDRYLWREGKFVSVWLLLMESIFDLLDRIEAQRPNAVVGIVLFSDDLIFIGDGVSNSNKAPPRLVMFDQYDGISKLIADKESEIMDSVKMHCAACMQRPIKETKNALKEALRHVDPNGRTALGPCLAAAYALLREARPGSKIMIFTDGKSNIGVGNLDIDAGGHKDTLFYDQMAATLKNKGIATSVYAFGAEECSLSDFNTLTNETQGIIERHANIKEKANIGMSYMNECISDIEINVLADRRLALRPINDLSSVDDKSVLVNKRMTIFDSSTYGFELLLRDVPKELIAAQPWFPIQVQITYIKDAKRLMRVATDRVIYSESPKEFNFKDYDVLQSCAGKMAKFALTADKERRGKVQEKLKKLQTFVIDHKNEHMTPNNERAKKACVDGIAKSINGLNGTTDKHVAEVDEQATTEIHWGSGFVGK